MPEERLQKILSQAGISSRRKAEELIQAGRVSVNGATITELGSKADLERDSIKVDNKLLRAPKRHLYIALNKPKGCVTTMSDPEGRPTVMQLLRGVKERVFPVGRLDYNSEGRWGVARVCRLGLMQEPPLAWRHDGRPALGDLVRWTDWEHGHGG